MKANERSASVSSGQAELFPLTLTGIRPAPPGQHIEFIGEVGGATYYCKRDKNGRPLRATEWFSTHLASHLNIPVPDFAAIKNPENDEVLFGSKGEWGTLSGMEVATFLTSAPSRDEAVGDAYPWLNAYLSRLYVYDLFIANPDRQLCNFLLAQGAGFRRLLAFDFASANLDELGSTKFPIAGTETMFVGRQLRKMRPFDNASAIEMIDWIGAIPISVIEGILASMPDDWMSDTERGKVCGQWSNGKIGERLAALRSGIGDESLL